MISANTLQRLERNPNDRQHEAHDSRDFHLDLALLAPQPIFCERRAIEQLIWSSIHEQKCPGVLALTPKYDAIN